MSTTIEEMGMNKESAVLNIICLLAAIGLIAFAVVNALLTGDFLTTDNLFLTTVCLVLALMFAASPLISLLSSGKVPLPFISRKTDEPQPVSSRSGAAQITSATAPPLLDAKGRPVPPDVRAMVDRMKQPRPENS